MKHILFTAAFLISTFISFAQGDYIIKDGKEISGSIKWKANDYFMNYFVKFKKEGSTEWKKYQPNELNGYGNYDNTFVTTNFHKGGLTFMRLVVDNDFKLFKVCDRSMSDSSVKDYYYLLHKNNLFSLTHYKLQKDKESIAS